MDAEEQADELLEHAEEVTEGQSQEWYAEFFEAIAYGASTRAKATREDMAR
jgi:hypothetical protein